MRIETAFLVVLLLASGCGKLKPKSEPGVVDGASSSPPAPAPAASPAPGTAFARDLGLRILPASASDPAMPDFGASSETYRAVPSELDVAILDAIPLIPKKGLFFAWDRKAFGSEIVDAHYELRTYDSRSQLVGDPFRESAVLDERSGTWFIPVEHLFRGHLAAVSLAEDQEVQLDLHLATRENVLLRVHFRASGPLPAIGAKPGPAAELQPGSLDRAGGSYVFQRLVLENPESRELRLWVRPIRAEPMLLRSWVRQSYFEPRDQQPWDGPFYEVKRSDSRFRWSGLLIEDAGGPAMRPVSAGKWMAIRLPARSEVTLGWVGEPVAGTPVCPPPSDESATLSWISMTKVHHADLSHTWWTDEPVTHSQPVVYQNSYVGYRFDTDLEAEIRVADPLVPENEATSEELPVASPERVTRILSGVQTIREVHGIQGGLFPRGYDCQGHF